MSVVAASGRPSLSTQLPDASHKITGLLAGEAITAGQPCYIKSDGKVWLSVGAAANAAAKVDGWAFTTAAVGESCTIGFDVNFNWGSGLTPGARYYLGTSAGTIDSATTTGGTAPIAFAVDATRIRVLQSRY